MATVKCEGCGEPCELRSDEEMLAEWEGVKDIPPEARAVVCSDCFKRIGKQAAAAGLPFPEEVPGA